MYAAHSFSFASPAPESVYPATAAVHFSFMERVARHSLADVWHPGC